MASEPRPDPALEGAASKDPIDTKAATVADDSQASDNEGGERPVRNKLRDTSITSTPKPPVTDSAAAAKTQDGSENSRASSRGRKRSLDEDQPEVGEEEEEEVGHRRKRSRDNSYEEENAAANDSAEKILSPKKKRSRDQIDKEEPKPEDAAEKPDEVAVDSKPSEKVVEDGQPEKKRHRDSSQERDKPLVTGAFANTSAVSPFGSLGASKPKEEEPSKSPATSSSAFASSSFAAFASSEKSPFGTPGSSSGSVFKSPAPTEAPKPAATGFASAAGTSGFAALGSGFSSFGGGFGAAAPKGGLTSFASPAGPSVLGGSSNDKPFGAPAEEEEADDEDAAAESGPGEFEAEKTDERFFERPLETGEEEEKTYFSCKAKLFQFSANEWRERGIGSFKINVRIVDGQENKKAARMIMRADGVGRVMLNTPLFKGMTVGDASGNEPKSKQIHLASLENDRSVPCLLRTPSEDLAKELYHVVGDLLEHQ
ncbi:hypothetical protein BDV59DRAFT_198122 [Aspergillus ambiguus]|uniref:uncharacterized protein n=1 Tax=Aspergillus ambiguus TaxID=176160 RepID=UPI003CCD6AA7